MRSAFTVPRSKAGQDHWQRLQLSSQRMKKQPKTCKGEGSEEKTVARFAEDHICSPNARTILEDGRSLSSESLRTVGEAELLRGHGLDTKSFQDRSRDNGVDGSRVNEELDLLRDLGLRRVCDFDLEDCKAHCLSLCLHGMP